MILILTILLNSCIHGNANSLYFKQRNRESDFSDATDFELPNLPPSYRVRSEANFANTSKSQTAVEYEDGKGRRRSMSMIIGGIKTTYILDYRTTEFFIIKDNCVVKNTSYPPPEYKDMFLIDLYNSAKKNLRYAGTPTIRGIASVKMSATIQNTQMDWYFAEMSWVSAITFPAVPLRVVLTDTIKLTVTTIDYYDFNPVLPDDLSVFQPPVEIFCPGRVKSKDLPKLPPSFSFTMRIMNQKIDKVTTLGVWYDKDKYLVRVDWQSEQLLAPYWTTDPIIELQDYTTGVQYFVNQIHGNCTVAPMGKYVTLYEDPTNGSHPFPSPEYLLQLDADYTYIGQRSINGFTADAFQALKDEYLKTIYYAESEGSMVPILLTVGDENGETIDKIFLDNYSTEELKSDELDFSVCWTDDQILHARMYFPDMDPSLTDKYSISISRALRENLYSQLSISQLRISDSSFHHHQIGKPTNGGTTMNGVYAVFDIYDRIDSIYKFRSTADYPNVKFRERSMVPDTDINTCADACEDALADVSGMYEDNSGFYCSGFNYCESTRQCTLYEADPEMKQGAPPKGGCDVRKRTSQLSGFTERKLSTVWSLLQTLVNSRTFRLELEQPDITGSYLATMVTEDDARSYNITEDADLKEFSVYLQEKKLVSTNLVRNGFSVEQCATACVNHPTSLCPIFSICYTTGLTGQCTIGGDYPDEQPTSYTSGKDCYLYTRNYLSWFEVLPGDFPPPSQGTHITGVPGVEDCAKTCYKTDNHGCDIFYFDFNTFECWTSQSMVLDIVGYPGGPSANLRFKAFAIKHKLNYFDQTNSTQMADVNATMVSGSTAEDCAEICKKLGYHSCRRFSRTTSGQCRFSNQFTGPTVTDSSSTLYTLKSKSRNASSTLPSSSSPTSSSKITGVTTMVIDPGKNCQTINVQPLDASRVQFTLYKQDTALSSDEATRASKVESCMFYCLAEATFQCEAISFCPEVGLCRLGRYHPDLNSTILLKRIECQTYARNYVSEYHVLPGTKLPGDADKEDKNIPSANICAKRCTERTEFMCRSFDYCPDTGQCLTWKSHDQQHTSNQSLLESSCAHYSRNYLIDFKKKAHRNFKPDVKYELHFGLSLSQCADTCVDEEDATCKSFVVCPDLNQCRILSVHPRTDEGAELIPSQDNCDVYTREYYRTGINPTVPPTVTIPSCPTQPPLVVPSCPTQPPPVVPSCPTQPPPVVPSCPTQQSSLTSHSPSPSTSASQDKSTKDATETEPTSSPQTTYSIGTVGGVGAGMVFLGVLIGLLAYHVIHVIKEKRTNDLEMMYLTQDANITTNH